MIIDTATGLIISLAPALPWPGGWQADGVVYDAYRHTSVDAVAPPHVIAGEWRYVNGGFRPVNFTEAEINAAKLAAIRRAQKIADGLRDKIIAGAHPMEVQGWIAKATEALANAADPRDDAKFPMIKLEAAARGVAPDALVAKIAAKRAALINAEAAIEGARGRHKDAIRAMATVDELDAYDITTGWPVI